MLTITRLFLKLKTLVWGGGGGGGVGGLLGLARRGSEVRGRVWNWVWFLNELREFISIPNE